MAADRGVGADLEVGPAQLVLDLPLALLDPVADAVDPHHLGQVRGRVRAAGLAQAARLGQVRGQVPGGLVRQGGRVGGGDRQAGEVVASHQPSVASAACQVSACSSRNVRTTGSRSPGSSGPP
jgi:hypothetical protein